MGEQLPRNIAQKWREWCCGSGYVKEAIGKTIQTHWYDKITFPSFWVVTNDDDIANEKSMSESIELYSQSKIKTLVLKPKELGISKIGHMGFFSKRHQQLWNIALDWLNENNKPN